MSVIKDIKSYFIEIIVISVLVINVMLSAITLYVVAHTVSEVSQSSQKVITLKDVVLSPVFTDDGSIYLINKNDSLSIKYKIDGEVVNAIYSEKLKQVNNNNN